MKKALFGALLGLFIGGAVWLYFSWVNLSLTFRLVPPRIVNFEFYPQMAVTLFQCLVSGVIAGSATYYSGRCWLGVFAAIIVAFGLGFLFVGLDDQPWGMIGAMAMLLPLVFVGVLSRLAAAVAGRRDGVPDETRV